MIDDSYTELSKDPEYLNSIAHKSRKAVETVTITISKGSYGWASWVIDHNGNDLGGATAASFAEVYDLTHEIITGDSGEPGDVHNEWVDFNSNDRKR